MTLFIGSLQMGASIISMCKAFKKKLSLIQQCGIDVMSKYLTEWSLYLISF